MTSIGRTQFMINQGKVAQEDEQSLEISSIVLIISNTVNSSMGCPLVADMPCVELVSSIDVQNAILTGFQSFKRFAPERCFRERREASM